MMIVSMVWLQVIEKRLKVPDLPPMPPPPVELQVCSSEAINKKSGKEEYAPLQEKNNSICICEEK
jgi:hypothetical protein